MAYFNPFPYVSYQFPDNKIKVYKNLSIRPSVIEDIIGDYSNLENYIIQDGETPETIAFDKYGSVDFHWTIMLTNNIMNLYTDWPVSEETLRDYVYEKYRVQKDSEGVEYTLTDEQVYEFVEFVGTTTNNFISEIDLDNGRSIVIRPHHFVDENGNEFPVDTFTNTVDAWGRPIDNPTLYPVSHLDYEISLNDAKKEIFLPTQETVRKMQRELGPLVNE